MAMYETSIHMLECDRIVWYRSITREDMDAAFNFWRNFLGIDNISDEMTSRRASKTGLKSKDYQDPRGRVPQDLVALLSAQEGLSGGGTARPLSVKWPPSTSTAQFNRLSRSNGQSLSLSSPDTPLTPPLHPLLTPHPLLPHLFPNPSLLKDKSQGERGNSRSRGLVLFPSTPQPPLP